MDMLFGDIKGLIILIDIIFGVIGIMIFFVLDVIFGLGKQAAYKNLYIFFSPPPPKYEN